MVRTGSEAAASLRSKRLQVPRSIVDAVPSAVTSASGHSREQYDQPDRETVSNL